MPWGTSGLTVTVAYSRDIHPSPAAPSTVVGTVLAIAGLVALVGLPSGRSTGLLVGAVLAFASAFGYATLTLAGGTISIRWGAQRPTRLAFAVAAVLLVPVTSVTVGLGPDPTVWAAMIYLGIVPMAVAYRLFFAGLQHVPPSAAAILVLLNRWSRPGWPCHCSVERLTPLGWMGALALVVAVLVVSGVGRRPAVQPHGAA